MLANLSSSLIVHKRIQTTVAKAKALRRYMEPLLTKSKNDTLHSRRVVYSYLQNKAVINELFNRVGERIANRPGGYTRIIKLGFRQGDNAELCMIEFVDYNELLLSVEKEAKPSTKSRRSRRRGKGKSTTNNANTTKNTNPQAKQEKTTKEAGDETPREAGTEDTDAGAK